MSGSTALTSVRRLRSLLAARQGCEQCDEQLLAAFADRRDEIAFATLVRRHGPMVLGVCRRVLGHVQDAEDAYQATFLVLARRAAELRDKTALASFLYGIAYHMASKIKRAAGRRRKCEGALGALTQRRSLAEPADELLWREVRELLDAEIARLPEKYRSVFVLCCLENMSRAEAGQCLGLKERTVLSRLAEARKRLRQRLARRGVELTAVLAATSLATPPVSAVPAGLMAKTIQAALATAAGEAMAGIVPASVMELVQGTTAAMMSKVKIVAVLLLAASMLAGASGWVYRGWTTNAFTLPAQPTEQPAASSSSTADDIVEILGNVQDPDSKPLEGVKIYLSYYRKDRTKPKVRATSGPDGRFRFTFLKSEVNPYYSWFTEEGWRHAAIVAVAAGYGPQWVEAGALENSKRILRLVKDDVPIEGRVLDLEGRPIAGATVHVSTIRAMQEEDLAGFLKTRRLIQHKELLPWTAGLNDTLTTDKHGRFRLTGIGRERIAELDIGGPTLETIGVRVLSRKGIDEKTLNTPRLEDATIVQDPPRPRKIYGAQFDHLARPTKPFAGTVRDKATGRPLARVRISMIAPDGTAHHPMETVTDARGHYRLIGGPKANSYRLTAAAASESGYLIAYRSAGDAPGMAPITVDFELSLGVVIQGHLRDKETGKPIRGDVSYQPLSENANSIQLPQAVGVRVSGDGAFRLVALPGPGVVRATNHDGRFLHARLAPDDKAKGINVVVSDAHAYRIIAPTKAGQLLTCDLDLVPGKTRRVSIVDAEGKPLTGVSVYGLSDRPVETQTLAKATCTVVGLDTDRPRRLTFLHTERKLAGEVLLRGDEPELVKVKLEPWGAVKGRVLDADGRRPIAGAKIELYHFTRNRGEIVGAHRPNHDSALTDPDGRFRVEGLVPGVKYIVFVSKKELPPLPVVEMDDVTVEAGKTKHLGETRAKQPAQE